MTKKQLVQIAKAGYPEHIVKLMDFKNMKIFHMGGVYRLYDPREGFNFMLPKKQFLTVFIGPNKFVQISRDYPLAFNHYAAIKEMEKMGLV